MNGFFSMISSSNPFVLSKDSEGFISTLLV
jgi:hypothetical protein